MALKQIDKQMCDVNISNNVIFRNNLYGKLTLLLQSLFIYCQ